MPGPGRRVFNNIRSCFRYNCQRQMLLYADYQLIKKTGTLRFDVNNKIRELIFQCNVRLPPLINSWHSIKPGAVVVGRDLDQLYLVYLTK